MGTIALAVVLAILFFCAPIAVILGAPFAVIIGALGFWIGGGVGALIGAVLGLFMQGPATPEELIIGPSKAGAKKPAKKSGSTD